MIGGTVLWLAASGLAAGGREAWDALGEAELRAAYGAFAEAADLYQELASSLPDEDPARARALYGAGRLYRHLGRPTDAVAAFDACVRIRAWRAACLAERTEVELDRSAVSALPVRWTFDDTEHGLVHPPQLEAGALRIAAPPSETDPCLAWSTELPAGGADALHIAWRGGLRPRTLSLRLKTGGDQAELQWTAIDLDGRMFTSDPFLVGTDWSELRWTLDALTDPRGEHLQPSALYRLVLQQRAEAASERILWLDDLVIE
jgi:tetratricopeptide (TPR) repeat protein